MSTAAIRIALMVEQEAKLATSADGHWEQKTLVDRVRKRLNDDENLTPDIKDQVAYDSAAHYARAFVDRRKPKTDKVTGALFHPDYVLPLGDGKRVWMDQATNSDLMSWAALETANTAKVLIASSTRQAYVAKCLRAFADNPKWTLGRVERDSFGWVETAEPPDESDDEGTE